MPTDRPMVVDVVVKVKVADREPQSRHGEARFEDEAIAAVADCLSKERSVEFIEAALLGFEHCKWVHELGQPVNCGLPGPVRLHTDGSWSYPFEGQGRHSGRDFASLVAFIWRQLCAGGLAEPLSQPTDSRDDAAPETDSPSA